MRKASLNLSVNAIVVFVLAFAMLGVGLTFTSLIRENVTSATKDIIPKSDFNNPPTADNPITITDELSIKRGAKKNIDLGFYNKGSGEATDARMGISQCISDDGTDMGNTLPNVVSPSTDVEASDWAGFKIIVDTGATEDIEDAYTAGDYVCTFVAWDGGTNVFEEKQIFMTVTS